MYKKECRSCSSDNLNKVMSLGMSPLANNLLSSVNDNDELYPLELMYCEKCTNVQLSYVVPPEKMFDDYLYVSSTAKSFRDHFGKAAKLYRENFNLNHNSLVVDIGSNDGVALKPFKDMGIGVLGVDPASNLVELANNNGIKTVKGYFDINLSNKIKDEFGLADIVTASNVFAHSDKLKEIVDGAFNILKRNGCFIVEVQYLFDTLNDMTFDNIYHEHVNFWSVTSIGYFFDRLDYAIAKVEHIDTHGGSIRLYVYRRHDEFEVDKSVYNFIKREKEFKLNQTKTYLDFSDRVQTIKNNVRDNFKKLKQKYKTIVGYGSPAKATTSLNYFEINNEYIDYIVEDNSLKHNKLIPNVRIPIFSKDKLNESIPDVIIVMAWNFFEEIKKNNSHLIEKGVKFYSIKDLEKEEI